MSTVSLTVGLYLVVIVWQPLWTEGFRNFGDISRAISRLDRTAKPVAEMAPLMLAEMDEMRNSMSRMQKSVDDMNPSIKNMNHSVNHMSRVMDHRMGAMTGEMAQMGDRFTPAGMMPFNW